MKIALVQMNCIVGDVEGNAHKILKFYNKAKALGANLVCFSEMVLVGYPPRDLLDLPYFISEIETLTEEIAKKTDEVALVFGSIARSTKGVGAPLYNQAVWCERGTITTRVSKRLLPSYDVFDETRYFEPGSFVSPIEFCGKKIGLTICEDIWNISEIKPHRLYAVDPVEELKRSGANLMINLSASPYSKRKIHQRIQLLQKCAKTEAIDLLYVNQVGGNDELIFDGGSMFVSSAGKLLILAPFFKEHITLIDTEMRGNPSLTPLDEVALTYEALVLGLKDYVKKCGFKKVVLGLSGGVDSALVAALAVKALGPKNVVGVLMSSRYTSKESIQDALKLAKNLKIETKTISIDKIHRSFEASFVKLFGKKKTNVTEENIQARIRGNLLMAFSNKEGHMVLTTGNKSELAVGYSTLYGDMVGGLAVISDLYKGQVYELCRLINRRKNIIPENILNKAPTAELKPNQKDQDTLPPYDQLDGILKLAIEDGLSEEEILEKNFPRAVVRKVLSMIKKSEYKRRQLGPGLKVSGKAFGMGRRFPIASKYQ